MDKWQRIANIVNQNGTLKAPNLQRQFTLLWLSRLLTENIFIFLFQYSGLMLSQLTSSPSLLWFASGTAVGFMYLRGYRIMSGIWLGSFLAYYFANSGIILASSCATVITLQAFLIVSLNFCLVGPTLVFYRLSLMIKFFMNVAAITAFSSLLLVMLCYNAIPSTMSREIMGLQWWLANLNGVLIFAMAIVTWDMYFPQIAAMQKLGKVRLCAMYATLLAVVIASSVSDTLFITILCGSFALLLILLISSLYGWCGAIFALFIVGGLLTVVKKFQLPLLATKDGLGLLFFWQGLLIVALLFGLTIAIRERQEGLRGS